WKKKPGVMVIVVFSKTEEGLNFFADSVNSAKEKMGKNLKLVLCGKLDKKTSIKADLITEDLDAILEWSQSTFESSVK
ncbi:MAG: ArsR family transcriptional regulator, partial [Nitrosopumilaceae archaeon]|nr:ArsR family transcriptional regulator [Nitrosopumilaceae archaeon]